jgi:hypothetical protein
MCLPPDHTVARYRASVEDVFVRLCGALHGACGGLAYQSHASVVPEPRTVEWYVHHPEDGPQTAHALLARDAAEAQALHLYSELLDLFPKVPAYAEAPWARPRITAGYSLGVPDRRMASIDLQPDLPTSLRIPPRGFSVDRAARRLSALWSLPLLWSPTEHAAGVWELSSYTDDNSRFKPRFWAPDGVGAQLVGALFWDTNAHRDWISGRKLAVLVRRLPEEPRPMGHLRAFLDTYTH